MIGCILTPYIIPKWFEGRLVIIISVIMMGILTVLVGPAWEDKNMTVMLIGLASYSIFLAPTVIPNMSEMILATRLAYPDADLEHANNLLSGLLGFCCGIGQAAGPLVGSAIYETMGFRALCDITAGFTVVFGILYLVCAQGCQSISSTCNKFRQRNVKRALSQEEIIEEELIGIRHSSWLHCPVIMPQHKRAFASMNSLSMNKQYRSVSANPDYTQNDIEIDVYAYNKNDESLHKSIVLSKS